MDFIEVKETIEGLLRSTKREGVEDLLKYMDSTGFYSSPASTKFHGAEVGALARHSLEVYDYAYKVATVWCTGEWLVNPENHNGLIIAALLHDLGKAGQFGKPLYVEHILKTGQSKAQPYEHNKDLITLDHEIVSVIEASKYIELTEEEQFAIAYHNGLYTAIGRYELQGKERPLQMLIHASDMWVSRFVGV